MTYKIIKRVLIAADDALKSAVEAKVWPFWPKDKISEEVDKKFGDAIDLLSAFDKDFPSKDLIADPNIGETITREAEMRESPPTILDALKRNLHAKVMFPSIFIPPHADEF